MVHPILRSSAYGRIFGFSEFGPWNFELAAGFCLLICFQLLFRWWLDNTKRETVHCG